MMNWDDWAVKLGWFLETVPEARIIVDRTGRIEFVNRRTESVFGYRREELIGQTIELLVPERFRGAHVGHRASHAEQMRARPMGSGLDLYARRKDGAVFPVDISLWTVKREEETFILTAVRDTTEPKRLQAQLVSQHRELEQVQRELEKTVVELQRSNNELQQFAYVASHDLQEPLRMVSSYMQLLAKRYKGQFDSDADEFIAYAVDGAHRAQRLIQDLLAHAGVTTKGRVFAPTSVETTLGEALDNLRGAVEASGAVVTHGPLPTVIADAGQLRQLFQNLLGNALKFRGEEPPRVHVSCEQRGGEWRCSVRDNGIGIDPQYAERIFIIFQRLHQQAEYPGTGIGLALCKKIVERHGGRIWVESQPGKGATFCFTLPLPSPPALSLQGEGKGEGKGEGSE